MEFVHKCDIIKVSNDWIAGEKEDIMFGFGGRYGISVAKEGAYMRYVESVKGDQIILTDNKKEALLMPKMNKKLYDLLADVQKRFKDDPKVVITIFDANW